MSKKLGDFKKMSFSKYLDFNEKRLSIKTSTLKKKPYKRSTHILICCKLNNQIDASLELETEKRRERPKFFDCIRDMSNLDQMLTSSHIFPYPKGKKIGCQKQPYLRVELRLSI